MRIHILIFSLIYINLHGITPNELNELKHEAQNGDAEAQHNLGRFYYSGDKNLRDPVEAFKWLTKAANQGHAKAQSHLGVCYQYGEGVSIDQLEAVKWYEKAAKQGDTSGQFFLGTCYHYGSGVIKDNVEAYAYLNLAATNEITPRKFRISIEKEMTPSQIEAGQKRSRELLSEIEVNKSGNLNKYLVKLVAFVRAYSDIIIFVVCTLLVGASYTLIKEKLTKSNRGRTKLDEEKIAGSSYSRSKDNKVTYFNCWWKTTLVLLLFQGLLGYLNSGTQGMAVMLGRGLLLSPLHALWIAWIWWRVNK